MTRDYLFLQHRWQFKYGQVIDGSVPPQWFPTLEKLFYGIGAAIPAHLHSAFSWRDIKEKHGSLAVDYEMPDMSNLDEILDGLIDAAMEKIHQINFLYRAQFNDSAPDL